MTFEDTIMPVAGSGDACLLPDWPCVFVESIRDSDSAMPIVPLPCPFILIGDAGESDVSAFDMCVPGREEARVLFDRISARPNAARVIVGLLRMLPRLSIADGLQAESLAYGMLQAGGEFCDWLSSRRLASAIPPEGKVNADRRDDVLYLEMDRPEADNAIDRHMRDGLALMFQLAVADRTIRRIVLTGAGRSFSLGADLAEFGTTLDPAVAHVIRQQTLPAHWAAACSDRFEAHIQGACVGAGLELAAFASRITAGPRAWFQLPELAMGLLPGAGGCVSLTRRIGRQRTAELILSGRRLSARTALEWGLVDEIAVDQGRANQT